MFFEQAFRKCNTFFQSNNFLNKFIYEQEILVPPTFTNVYKVIHHYKIKSDNDSATTPSNHSNTCSFLSSDLNKNYSLRTTEYSFPKVKDPNRISHFPSWITVQSPSVIKTY